MGHRMGRIWFRVASLAVVLPGAGASAFAGAQAAQPDNYGALATIVAAVIALLGVLASVGTSALLARREAHRVITADYTKRQAELALKISDMASSTDGEVREAAMRRFAVAIVKIVAPKGHKEWGKVHFIPINSRVTIGRDTKNDIVLADEQSTLSRWHCGFIADQRSVWLDDFCSSNGTRVAGKLIEESVKLDSNTEIQIGQYKLRFRIVRENTVLSQ